MKNYSRSDRVALSLKKALAGILQMQITDPRLKFITVSDVELTKDLTIAKVFVTFLFDKSEAEISQALDALNKATPHIRSLLSKEVKLRQVPELRFLHDVSLLHGIKISNLINRS